MFISPEQRDLCTICVQYVSWTHGTNGESWGSVKSSKLLSDPCSFYHISYFDGYESVHRVINQTRNSKSIYDYDVYMFQKKNLAHLYACVHGALLRKSSRKTLTVFLPLLDSTHARTPTSAYTPTHNSISPTWWDRDVQVIAYNKNDSHAIAQTSTRTQILWWRARTSLFCFCTFREEMWDFVSAWRLFLFLLCCQSRIHRI